MLHRNHTIFVTQLEFRLSVELGDRPQVRVRMSRLEIIYRLLNPTASLG